MHDWCNVCFFWLLSAEPKADIFWGLLRVSYVTGGASAEADLAMCHWYNKKEGKRTKVINVRISASEGRHDRLGGAQTSYVTIGAVHYVAKTNQGGNFLSSKINCRGHTVDHGPLPPPVSPLCVRYSCHCYDGQFSHDSCGPFRAT